jgi:hypothetical protein
LFTKIYLYLSSFKSDKIKKPHSVSIISFDFGVFSVRPYISETRADSPISTFSYTNSALSAATEKSYALF